MIVGICGNIGAGKSSLTKLLVENFSLRSILENYNENPYLEDFYNSMKSWAFHSQLYFLVKKIELMEKLNEDGLIYIQDRTIYEDVFIFAKNLFRMGFITTRDWKLYFNVFNLSERKIIRPSCIFYIKCSVDTLKKRINKRGRNFEQNMSEKYLSDLNALYDEWYRNSKIKNKWIIDGDNFDFIENVSDRKKIIKDISENIAKMSFGIQSMLF
ncbi:MAG: deoxyadenosine/deoxycytidine kinase [Kosmotogales bacterium]|nr:deoxyadenosine/deoxycytidine kinase [Kosmotogales bacterium]